METDGQRQRTIMENPTQQLQTHTHTHTHTHTTLDKQLITPSPPPPPPLPSPTTITLTLSLTHTHKYEDKMITMYHKLLPPIASLITSSIIHAPSVRTAPCLGVGVSSLYPSLPVTPPSLHHPPHSLRSSFHPSVSPPPPPPPPFHRHPPPSSCP